MDVIRLLEMDFCETIVNRFYFELASMCDVTFSTIFKTSIMEENHEENVFGKLEKTWTTYMVDYVGSETLVPDHYAIIYSFDKNKEDILREIKCDFFSWEFAGTFLIGLIHEFRHVYQTEVGMFVNGSEHWKIPFSNNADTAEADAIEFAEKIFEENMDYYKYQLSVIAEEYQDIYTCVMQSLNEENHYDDMIELMVFDLEGGNCSG